MIDIDLQSDKPQMISSKLYNKLMEVLQDASYEKGEECDPLDDMLIEMQLVLAKQHYMYVVISLGYLNRFIDCYGNTLQEISKQVHVDEKYLKQYLNKGTMFQGERTLWEIEYFLNL